MDIFLNILFLIIGMSLLIKGADIFVSGASSIAKKLKVPSLFIGLTIVALGTSLPEFSVSLVSALKNSIDMSVGNIVGSNMVNMLLIFGIVALIKPIPVKNSSKKIDFPFLMLTTLLLLIFSVDTILNGNKANVITRSESLIFIFSLIIYLYLIIFNAKKEKNEYCPVTESLEKVQTENKVKEKILKNWQIALFIILGLGAVVFGAECVSTTAQFLALKMGMSEALIGLTIVAIGTSLPELATSIVAAIKGENDMALGNIIGSNIINILLILGSVGLITQVPVSSTLLLDTLILTVSTIFFSVLCISRKNTNKIMGAIFIFLYLAYMSFAIVRNYCF